MGSVNAHTGVRFGPIRLYLLPTTARVNAAHVLHIRFFEKVRRVARSELALSSVLQFRLGRTLLVRAFVAQDCRSRFKRGRDPYNIGNVRCREQNYFANINWFV